MWSINNRNVIISHLSAMEKFFLISRGFQIIAWKTIFLFILVWIQYAAVSQVKATSVNGRTV